MVYVDRFATNAPVAKAKVEVEGAGLKGIASETAPGTYVMDIAAAIAPASYPLTISIEAGNTADLLTATLNISQSMADVEPVHRWKQWLMWPLWLVTALILIAGGAWFLGRKKGSGNATTI